MGSALFLASWAVLLGPKTYGTHLLSGPRLPFTAVYFGAIALTLFFAFKVRPSSPRVLPHPHLPSVRYGLANVVQHQTILTLIAAIIQLVALIWYLISYFPMGGTGLRFAARFGTNRVAAWMGD